MKLGLCTAIENAGDAENAGFDYIEPGVANLIPASSDSDFKSVAEAAQSAPRKPEVFNCFVPGHLKITGPGVDLDKLKDYVNTVCARAAATGGKIIVFGSGAARFVPDGFAHEQAHDQLVEFLEAIAPIAGENGIVIAIEPLRIAECNIINAVPEGYELARQVNQPAIQALADLYHMGQNREPFEHITADAEMLAHVHLAHPETRNCPQPDDGYDYKPFFRALKDAGYDGRISLECSWENLGEQGPTAVKYMKEEWAKA